METTSTEQGLRDRLERCGDPRRTRGWHEGEIDYVATLALSASDVPQLIREARVWVEREIWPDDEDDLTVFAPVHAWRALGQLGAAEAIEPLLAMMVEMDDAADDWHLEEFPYLFAMIGPPAVEPLRGSLADSDAGEFVRICAAHGLQEIAARHEETRDDIVALLVEQLRLYDRQPRSLNALLVNYLLKLGATEHADDIERPFAADKIDVQAAGNWNSIMAEYGITGRGIVSPELAAKRPYDEFLARRARVEEPPPPLPAAPPKTRRYKHRKRKSR